jgi:hypothetical protein
MKSLASVFTAAPLQLLNSSPPVLGQAFKVGSLGEHLYVKRMGRRPELARADPNTPKDSGIR